LDSLHKLVFIWSGLVDEVLEDDTLGDLCEIMICKQCFNHLLFEAKVAYDPESLI